MYFWHFVREESHERWDSTQLPSFGLDGVVHVAKMLEIGGRIRLDHAVRVVQELDHLVQVGVAPLNPWGTCVKCNKRRIRGLVATVLFY